MPFNLFRRNDTAIEEATPTVKPPKQQKLSRQGYVQGVPIGGATVSQPGTGTSGLIDRADYLDQLMQAYLACPHASASVDVIARTITAGGIQCRPNTDSYRSDQVNTDRDVPKPTKQILEIQQLLAYVNPNEDIRQLMRGVITDLLIFGDAYTEVVYISGKPAALFMLDPQTMSVQCDKHGMVTGYHQKMQNGLEADFAPHEVIHVKFDAPGSGLYGVSPTNKCILPITTWLFTSALLKETMKKGDPLRAWVDWPIAMSEPEMKRFQQQYAIRNMGAANIGNLLETKGGTQLKELGQNQLAHWMQIKQQCRDEIYTGYGVPPSKVGVIEAGNLGAGTGTSQDRMFNVNTCGPIGEIVLEKFTFHLLYEAYGITDWHLAFGQVDWRDDMIIEQIADLRVRNGRWTINESRAVIGQPPVDGGDTAFIVDRQAIVLYEDLNDYSKASVSAVAAKGVSDAGVTNQAQRPASATPKASSTTPKSAPPPTMEGSFEGFAELDESWKREYAARRTSVVATTGSDN